MQYSSPVDLIFYLIEYWHQRSYSFFARNKTHWAPGTNFKKYQVLIFWSISSLLLCDRTPAVPGTMAPPKIHPASISRILSPPSLKNTGIILYLILQTFPIPGGDQLFVKQGTSHTKSKSTGFQIIDHIGFIDTASGDQWDRFQRTFKTFDVVRSHHRSRKYFYHIRSPMEGLVHLGRCQSSCEYRNLLFFTFSDDFFVHVGRYDKGCTGFQCPRELPGVAYGTRTDVEPVTKMFHSRSDLFLGLRTIHRDLDSGQSAPIKGIQDKGQIIGFHAP